MIFDCFIFFNELELLQLRLHELSPVVDKFVLVEATETFQGKPKPLYYSDNKEAFKAFSNRIVPIIVEFPKALKDPWEREFYQRNQIMEGLKDCSPKDTIILSDVDEIPRPEKIVQYKDKPGIKIFKQRIYCYFLNYVALISPEKIIQYYKDKPDFKHRLYYYYLKCVKALIGTRPVMWYGSVMTHYDLLISLIRSPQSLRNLRFHNMLIDKWGLGEIYCLLRERLKGRKIIIIEDGGWHFSYIGGIERIIQKIESFSHAEYNKDEYKDSNKIKYLINTGRDIFGGPYSYKFIPIDDSFPTYLRNNVDKYAPFILKGEDTVSNQEII